MWMIEVTAKGETGYLHTTTSLDLRTQAVLVLDVAEADTFATQERAEHFAAKVFDRFDAVRVILAA